MNECTISQVVTCLVLLGASQLASKGASGQAILNTEESQIREVSGLHANADLSLSITRGNSDVVNVRTSGIVGVMGERHWLRLMLGGRYLSNEKRSILDGQFVQLSLRRAIFPLWTVAIFSPVFAANLKRR